MINRSARPAGPCRVRRIVGIAVTLTCLVLDLTLVNGKAWAQLMRPRDSDEMFLSFGNDMVDGGGISELGETIGLNPFVVNTTATQTVDFLDPSGIVSDRVTIPPFTARLFSDVPENLPLSGLPPIAPNAVRLTVAQSEAVDINVSLASDSESGGNPSDTLSLNAMVDGVFMPGILSSTISEAAEQAGGSLTLALPQIIVTFLEPNSTLISDQLFIDPITLTALSDLEVGLPPSGGHIVNAESGTVFTLAAISDVPEPSALPLLLTSLAALGLLSASGVRRRA